MNSVDLAMLVHRHRFPSSWSPDFLLSSCLIEEQIFVRLCFSVLIWLPGKTLVIHSNQRHSMCILMLLNFVSGGSSNQRSSLVLLPGTIISLIAGLVCGNEMCLELLEAGLMLRNEPT